jgi:hypothetical protein
MKKWTMNTTVLIKNLNVIAESKVEAMEKARNELREKLNKNNIEYEEDSIKVNEKSIVCKDD